MLEACHAFPGISRRLRLACLVGLVGLIPGRVLAEGGGQAEIPQLGTLSPGVEHSRDQAVLYLRHGKFAPALRLLTRVYKTPAGRTDFLTVSSRGRAAFELKDIELAGKMVLEAERLAQNDRDKGRVEELKAMIQAEYGSVLVGAADGEQNRRGRLFLSAESQLINRSKRELVQSVRTRLQARSVTLPTVLFLPYGQYRLNGVPFSIDEGQPRTDVSVFLRLHADEEVANRRTWWLVGSSVAAVAIVGVASFMLFQEPEVEHRDGLQLQLR